MVFNEYTGFLEITPEDLYNSDEIVFYALSPSLPSVIEEATPDLERFSSIFRDKLEPTYKR